MGDQEETIYSYPETPETGQEKNKVILMFLLNFVVLISSIKTASTNVSCKQSDLY